MNGITTPQRIGWLGLLLGSFMLASVVASAADRNGTAKTDPSSALFSSSSPLNIRIEVPEAAMNTLRQYEWQFGKQVEREAVQVTVREGNNVYTNVSMHLKGAAGSFRPVDDHPALTLNFDKFVRGQRFHGLTKLSLNNSVQDESLVNEQLSRELFLRAGIPTPRATHARVELNGRDLGLYVLVEGWNRDFVKRHFKNTRGDLYDGGFLKEVTDHLSTNAGGNSTNQPGRIALADAANEKDLGKRQLLLEKTLDIERFLTLVAMDVILWNWDGYALNRNNWRLYHDLQSGRMVFMPHGLDQMFWNAEGSILPPMQGLVAKAVLQIPEYRQRYLARIKELRGAVFEPEAVANRARAIAAKFSPVLKEYYPDDARRQEKALDDLCNAIIRRGKSLDEQLAKPLEPAVFDDTGYARLSSWVTKSDFGFPALTKASGDNGLSLLEITTKQGSSIGSWRSKVWLEQGRYRLQGRVKTEGIVADPGDSRGGAGVRTGRNRPDKYQLGDSDWKDLDHEFSVDDPLTQVEIVCEFRGAEGRALFDLGSLRLKKSDPAPAKP